MAFENLVGRRFGLLTVIHLGPVSPSGRVAWVCACDCGNEKTVLAYSLKNGETQSCGCIRRRQIPRENLTGQRFGRLTVTDYLGNSRYRCVCDCGRETCAPTYRLKKGITRSCGCLRREVAAKKATKHGESASALYHVLHAMHQRCENPKSRDYQWYGALGVTIYDGWKLTEYPNFKAWALANGYRPGLTIDRIDPTKGYNPNNCRWITMSDQQRNKRKQHKKD